MSLKKLETHFWRHRNTIHISCEKCNGYLGAEQYSSYKERVFVFGSKSTYETIKRNKFSLYKNTNTVVISKTQKKVASLKQDYQLYSNFYVACQNREDLEQFLAHAYPPSLSIYGEMHSTDKSPQNY